MNNFSARGRNQLFRLGLPLEDEDAAKPVVLGDGMRGHEQLPTRGEQFGSVIPPAAAAKNPDYALLAWPSGAPLPDVTAEIVQAKRVRLKRPDFTCVREGIALESRPEVAGNC